MSPRRTCSLLAAGAVRVGGRWVGWQHGRVVPQVLTRAAVGCDDL